MIEFVYTYILPIAIYLLVVSKYIAFKENEDNKIPFK